MNKIVSFLLFSILFGCQNQPVQNPESAAANSKRPDYALAIHGGAGTILKSEMTPEKEAAYNKALNEALDLGESVLKNGGSALDAVEKTVAFLEDCPLFNAGKGAVFNHEGKNELDASIMDGATQKAGAIGGVTVVKNPVKLARAVMEKSQHVLLTGRGADDFARENGLEIVAAEYFFTKERFDYWQQLQKEEAAKLNAAKKSGSNFQKNSSWKFGTVGCVALDKNGHLAAATSTGGMTNKRWNRLGDTPIIGAGTWADDESVAISCTGHGEFFIRYAVAHDVAARMLYGNRPLAAACDEVVMKKLVEKGGEGGLIAVDKMGNICLPFNSDGMYRGSARPGERSVAIYK